MERVKNDAIEQIIEVKKTDSKISHGLRYFHEKYQLPAVQVVQNLKRERREGLIEIVEANNFLKSLYL